MFRNFDLINKSKCYKKDVVLAFEAKMSTELLVSNCVRLEGCACQYHKLPRKAVHSLSNSILVKNH